MKIRFPSSNGTAITTVITGTSRGLGKELAAQYEQVGRLIVLNRTKTGRQNEVIVDLADKTSVEDASSLVQTALGDTKNVRFILNAALYGNDEKLADITPKALGELYYVNIFSQLSIVEALLQKGTKVSLIAISSGMGSISGAYYPTHFAYSGSKAALNLTIRLLQRAHPQLDYLIMDPGWMKTSMGGSTAPEDPRSVAAAIVVAARDARNWNASDGMLYASTGEVVGW